MRSILQTLLEWGASGYCWIVLSLNTLFFVSLATVLQPFRGAGVWNTLLQRWARVNLKLGFFVCDIEGLEGLSGPAILAVNHRSVFDICLIAAITPPPVYFVSREGLLNSPFVGMTLRRGGHIILPPRGAARTRRMLDQVAERTRTGGRVVVFPEGKRSVSDGILPLGAGAFRMAHRAGCPLIPVALVGTQHAFAKGSRMIRPSRIAVRFLKPRLVSKDEANSRPYRDSIRGLLARTANRLQASCGPRIRKGRSVATAVQPPLAEAGPGRPEFD
jgi:1-acyl-sn-glycerol-3-phosphate acyltransferase